MAACGAAVEAPSTVQRTACVVTVVERVTGLLLVGKSPDKTVKSVNKVLIKLLRESPLPVRTLTLDNGTEFHGYREVEAAR